MLNPSKKLSDGPAVIASCLLDVGPKLECKLIINANSKSSFTLRISILTQVRYQINLNS